MHAGLVGATGGMAYATHIGEPFSVLLGGAVMGFNYLLLWVMTGYACSAAANPDKPRRSAVAVGAFVLKFSIFMALIAGMFLRLPIEGMSFAVGATALVLAFVIEALRNQPVLPKGVA